MKQQKRVGLKFNSKEKLFRGYVELIQPLLNLTNSEATVFAHLLYLNNEKSAIPENDRFNLIFSTSSRKEMSSILDISDQVLQNCFTKLRKKKLIVNNSIPKQHQVVIDESTIELVLNLKLNDNV